MTPPEVTNPPEPIAPDLFMSQTARAPLALRHRMSLTPLSLKSGGVVRVMTWPRTLLGDSIARPGRKVGPGEEGIGAADRNVGAGLVAIRQAVDGELLSHRHAVAVEAPRDI